MYIERGIIHAIGEAVEGVSEKTGNAWIRQTVVIEIEKGNNIIQRIALESGTRTADSLRVMKVGDLVEVGFNIGAREYKGRWYNNLDLIYIDPVNANGTKPAKTAPMHMPANRVQGSLAAAAARAEAAKEATIPAPAFDATPADEDPDLPF